MCLSILVLCTTDASLPKLFIFGVFYVDVPWLEKNKGLPRTYISSKFLSMNMKSPRTCEWCRDVYYISVNHLKVICFVGHKISFLHTILWLFFFFFWKVVTIFFIWKMKPKSLCINYSKIVVAEYEGDAYVFVMM